VVAFALGGIEGVGRQHVLLALPLVLLGVMATWTWRRPLDLMLSGEEEAATMGVDTMAVRRWCIIWTSILTAAAVAVGANVAFVGLVVPHVMRSFVGHEHRFLIPAAVLGGGTFLVFCDVASRLFAHRMPLGVVTGLIGAPVFLYLLISARRGGSLG
jgi:iron complex transport system permease protein